jgi:hypothetical protein
MALNPPMTWNGPERRREQRPWNGPERRRSAGATVPMPGAGTTGLAPRLGAVIGAGVVAGLVFAVMEMALTAIVQGQPFWAPLHMIAAIVLGSGVLPPPPALDLGVAAVAVGVHMVLSLAYAALLGAIVLRARPASAWWIGLVFGIALYLINFYGFSALFPWFAEARGAIAFASHALYGLLLGMVYRAIVKRAG